MLDNPSSMAISGLKSGLIGGSLDSLKIAGVQVSRLSVSLVAANGWGDEPEGPKSKELLLDCLACSDRFPKSPFAWLSPISLVGKFDLLKMFSEGVLTVLNRLFVSEWGVRAVSAMLNTPN